MNPKHPLVSIIVPVYQSESYLDQCVQSVLSQTYQELELLLIDDESPDSCPILCDTYAAKDDRIRVIHQKNSGAGLARKAGLDIATGDYILFLDSDDWLDKQTVAVCVDIALRDNADCVLFGYVREYPRKSIPNPLFDQDFSYDMSTSEKYVHRRIVGLMEEELRDPYKIDSLSPFWGRLLRKETAQCGLFVSDREIGTSEDTIFNLYALDRCQISYVNRCFYHYRKSNPQSITTQYKPNLVEQWDIMYDLFQSYITQSNKAEQYRTPFLNRVACSMIGLGLNEINYSSQISEIARRIRFILCKPLYHAAFSQLDTSYCNFKWKVFFLLCKKKAAFPLVLLLHIINYLRSRGAA